MKGYKNDQNTLTLCLDCMHELYTEGEEWFPFPKHFEPDNCSECGDEISA